MKSLLKLLLPCLIFIGFAPALCAQQVTYDWKHTIPGYNYTAMCCMAADSSGDVFVGGRIDSVVTFIDTTLVHERPIGFLARFDPNGNMIWFKQFEHSTCVYSICFDSENKLYISGSFTGKVEINDSVFPTHDSDTSFFGMFLAKLETDGELIWAKTTGGSFYYETGYAKLKQMTIDHDDNILIVGYGIGELQFFDTTITYTRPLDSTWVTTPFPHWEYFFHVTNYLVKYDKNGQKLWIRDLGAYSQRYYSISTDYSNNILLTGIFAEGSGPDFILDTIVLTSGTGQNIFIAKYDPTGKVLWAQRAGGGQYSTNKGFDVCADLGNNVLLTGRVGGGNVIFNDSIFFTNGVTGNAFLTKYDSSGKVCWVNCLGSDFHEDGMNYNYGFALKVLNDEIYLGGFFADSLMFGFVNLISTNSRAGMVLRYDTDGNLLAALMDSVYENAVTPIEFVFTKDSAIYMAGNIAHIWNGSFLWDMFLGKFNQYYLSNIDVITQVTDYPVLIYPNPCKDLLIIDFEEPFNKKIILLNMRGDIIWERERFDKTVSIEMSDLSTGMYFLIIHSDKCVISKKIIKL